MLWFFFGFFSDHRFYLGRVGGAILQIVLNCFLTGLKRPSCAALDDPAWDLARDRNAMSPQRP
ncbi:MULTISPECIES: TM2 domain-containing protein [unclassified Methylobacterium]|uniref:NINE protein n=1 Tax=unclassified Methylobacterium TaxID=2615210 RepID=UPI002269ED8C